MNVRRAALVAFASLTLSFVLQAPARADVRGIWYTQTLPKPASPEYFYFGQDVAIDGGHIIVLAAYEGGQQALLYRRNSDGSWVYRRVLASHTGGFVSADVAMKNGIAAVRFGNDISIFEFSGGDYVRGTSAAPIRHPGGVAISGNRVLAGGNDCDYDAVVYQKGAGGNWAVTGRLDDNQGECFPEGLKVELNYDYALLRAQYGRVATAWRRNGTALDWVRAGALTVPDEMGLSDKPFALQGATAVANSGLAFRRNGNTWTPQGVATAIDHDISYGVTFDAVYRDGVMVTTESGLISYPRVYLEASPGKFDHVATLYTSDGVSFLDISGRTVVAAIRDAYATRFDVQVFNLPAPLRAATPIVNDFEDHDASELTFSGGQFALAARGDNDVLAQSNAGGWAVALARDSSWTDYQRIEADVTPTFGTPGGWVGLVARYTDSNNHYFVAFRDNNTFGIYKRVNGVNTLLREGSTENIPVSHLSFSVDGDELAVWVNGVYYAYATDATLTSGRAGLVTFRARADFDDLHVAATDRYLLLEKDYSAYGNIYGKEWTQLGGTWQVLQDEYGGNAGFKQSNLNDTAFAVNGTPVENQEITVRMKLEDFAPSQTGAWFGLVARYVDTRNHYYVTVRSTDELQIKKQVDGVTTVLASIPFKANPFPGQYLEYRFRVIGDQLQLFVEGELAASVHDSDIPRGQYGLATYRAAATWEYVAVLQP
jgi:hypothetical protein